MLLLEFEKRASDTKGALLTVDPSLLYKNIHGGYGEHTINMYVSDQAALVKTLANIRVVRLLVHGAANILPSTS